MRFPRRTATDLDAALSLNLRVFLPMSYQIPAMLETGSGAISSRAGLRAPALGTSLYTTAKHAIQGSTKTAALDYAASGINVIAPGPIDTELLSAGGEQAREWAVRTVPMGRLGPPEEVAAAAIWLCSDAASFITGATLEIDGGLAAS